LPLFGKRGKERDNALHNKEDQGKEEKATGRHEGDVTAEQRGGRSERKQKAEYPRSRIKE